MEWLQSFAVYVSVIARKQPQRVPDLMGYQVLILEASSEYKNDCSWSNIDTTLWLLAFSGQSQSLQILFQSLSYF